MSFVNSVRVPPNLRPAFIGDFLNREHVLAGGAKLDLSTFPGDDTVQVVVATGGAAANATTVPVTALLGPIPSGYVMTFGAAGSKKFAKLTEAADKGDVELKVEALPTALAAGDVGLYLDPSVPKRIHAGTPVYIAQSALEASAASGMKWKNAGAGATVQATDVVRLVAYDVTANREQGSRDENTPIDDVELLRKGTLIKVNFMYWESLSSSVKDKIRADYEVTVGAPGQEVAAA